MGCISLVLARSNRQYDQFTCKCALFLGSISFIAAELNVLEVIGIVFILVNVQVEGNGGTAILFGSDILLEFEVLPLLSQAEVVKQLPVEVVTRTSVDLCFDIGRMICASINCELNLLARVEHMLVGNEELALPVGEFYAVANINTRIQVAFANDIHRCRTRYLAFLILVLSIVGSSHRRNGEDRLYAQRIGYYACRLVGAGNTVTACEGCKCTISERQLILRLHTISNNVEPLRKLVGRLRLAHFQLHVVEVDDITVLHSREVESNRLEVLTVSTLRVVAINCSSCLNHLPFCAVIKVAKQLIVVVITRRIVGLGLESTSLFSLYLQSHLDFHSLSNCLRRINKELRVPFAPVGLIVSRVCCWISCLIGLSLAANNHSCAVIGGIGGIFHNLCESLELTISIILLVAHGIEFYTLAPVVAPEARPQRVSSSLHVTVDYKVFPRCLGKSTAT